MSYINIINFLENGFTRFERILVSGLIDFGCRSWKFSNDNMIIIIIGIACR
jgi:hypothetical protein